MMHAIQSEQKLGSHRPQILFALRFSLGDTNSISLCRSQPLRYPRISRCGRLRHCSQRVCSQDSPEPAHLCHRACDSGLIRTHRASQTQCERIFHIQHCPEFCFGVVIVVVIFRHVVFAAEQPTSETIFGALCIYLLVGFTFASVYGMLAAFQPNAFYLDPRTNLHNVPDRLDFVYSFGTMTSLGAAGITPVSSLARSFSLLEAILGVLYLAVLIARLIGAYRPNSRE